MGIKSWLAAALGCLVAANAKGAESVTVCARYAVQYGYSKGYVVDATLTSGRELDASTGTLSYDALSTYVVIFWSQDQASIIRLDWNTLSVLPVNGIDQRGRAWQVSRMDPGAVCF